MRIIYLCWIIGLSFFAAMFFRPQIAFASWPLNTADKQSSPHWAGTSLVWNDDRLGSGDIFIRSANQVVQPLISGVGNQILLGSSSQSIVYSDDASGTSTLILFTLANHAAQVLQKNSHPSNVSVWNSDAIWLESGQLNWWHAGAKKTRAIVADQIVMTPFGPAWRRGDTVTLWQSSSDVLLDCPGCTDVATTATDIATLDQNGQISLWPSNAHLSADPTGLQASDQALVYWHSGKVYAWQNGQSLPIVDPIGVSDQISPGGWVHEQSGDIYEFRIPKASVSVTTPLPWSNTMTLSGTTNVGQLDIDAVSNTQTFRVQAHISGRNWDATVLPQNAPDGTYTITAVVHPLFAAPLMVPLGQITLDRTSPTFTTQPQIDASLDTAKLHFVTDEKSDHDIVLGTIDDPLVQHHTTTRLTFSHTLTMSGLDPDQDYSLDVQARDSNGNVLRFSRDFHTASLREADDSSLPLDPGTKSIWRGIVLAEPNIVGKRKMTVLVDLAGKMKVIILDWTIGDPLDVHRGSVVRFIGQVNSAGTSVLMHLSHSLIELAEGPAPPVITLGENEQLTDYLWQWVTVSGTLRSVAKTGWVIEYLGQSYTIHWNGAIPTGYSRGDLIEVQGFVFLNGGTLEIGGSDVSLIQGAPTVVKATSTKVKAKVKPLLDTTTQTIVNQPVTSSELASAFTPSNAEETQIITTIISTADKARFLWYIMALLATGGVIIGLFFFRRRK